MLTREFSWSCLRFRLFNSCRRAYFFRYNASWEGWDKFSGETCRQIYQLKNLKKLVLWLEEIVKDSIRDIYILSRKNKDIKFSTQTISNQAVSLFYRKWDEAVSLSPAISEKQIGIFEFHYSDKSKSLRNQLMENSKEKLHDFIAKFAETKIFNELSCLPYISFKDIKNPHSFLLDGKIKVWTNTDFIWQGEDGKLNLVNIHSGGFNDQNEWDLRMGVSAIFAENVLHFPEDKISCASLFLNLNSDIPPLTIYAYKNTCEIRGIINESAARMLEFETAPPESFPPCSDTMRCGSCEFRELCENWK